MQSRLFQQASGHVRHGLGINMLERDLNYGQMKKCKDFLEQSLFVGSVTGMLNREVTSEMAQFFIDVVRLWPKQKYTLLWNKYFVPFYKEVLMWIFTWGIVYYRYRYIPEEDEAVPELVKGEPGIHYKLTTWYDPKTEKQQFAYYRLYSKRTGEMIPPKPDKNVFIRTDFGFMPGEDGSIKSIISRLIPVEFFIYQSRQYYLRAARQRSEPMLFLETNKDTPGVLDTSEMFGFYGDINRDSRIEDRRFRKNEAEIAELFRHQNNVFRLQMQMANEQNKGKGKDPSQVDIFKPQAENNMFPLPVGTHLTNAQIPETPGDIINLEKSYQEQVFAAFSLPRSLLASEGAGRLQGNAEMAEKMLKRAIDQWRNVLSTLMTDIYCDLFAAKDCITDLQSLSRFEIKNISNKELDRWIQDYKVQVKFPPESSVSFSTLIAQFQFRAISWEKFITEIYRMSGYDIADAQAIKDQKDPWSLEAKTEMLKHNPEMVKALASSGLAGQLMFTQTSPGASSITKTTTTVAEAKNDQKTPAQSESPQKTAPLKETDNEEKKKKKKEQSDESEEGGEEKQNKNKRKNPEREATKKKKKT